MEKSFSDMATWTVPALPGEAESAMGGVEPEKETDPPASMAAARGMKLQVPEEPCTGTGTGAPPAISSTRSGGNGTGWVPPFATVTTTGSEVEPGTTAGAHGDATAPASRAPTVSVT